MRVQVPPRGLYYLCSMRPIIDPNRRRQRKSQRRRDRTTVRDAGFSDMAPYLESYGPNQPYLPAGHFDPSKREVLMFKKDAPDVLEHELTHAEQLGPLSMALRPQDPTTRKAFRKIRRTLGDENFEDLTSREQAGAEYMLFQPHEFEAIVRGAIVDADKFGVDLTQDFDTVQKQLMNMSGGNSNLNLLLHASKALKTQEQKDLFMSSIRSNLGL